MTIDISTKPLIKRIAKATGTLYLSRDSIRKIIEKNVEKGDPLENAKLAAIHAVKKTPDLVFMAHPIPIEGVKTQIEVNKEQRSVQLTVKVVTTAKTGVEIEALAGVMNGLLAVFDMVKMYEKNSEGEYSPKTRIENVHVVIKEKR
ncbi:MAG: cyclic pyranopterin monophosphate synthase MoaC [Candidatus Hodarchaeales archaeon]